jgi:hypothetical protein
VISAEVKTLTVTTLVGMAHIICGIAVVFTPGALQVTPLVGLYDILIWAGYAPKLGAFILILVGLMAVYAANAKFAMRVTLLIPQQLLLFMQIWSISTVLVTGVYPDGYMPTGGSWFILTDQIWPWLLTASHSAWLAAFIYQGVRGSGDVT